jgi:uncharacterized protein YukE
MPDVDGTPILVHQGMQDLSPRMLAIAGQLVQELDDLERALQPMRETWIAQSSLNYQAVHQQWRTAANDLFGQGDASGSSGVLGAIARAVHTNWVNYVDVEDANRRTWQPTG